jgi:hypothetical protein
MDSENNSLSSSVPLRDGFGSAPNGGKPEFSSSERERLIREIQSTDKKREVVDFDAVDSKLRSPRPRRKSLHPSDERQARDPRDEARGKVDEDQDEAHYTKIPTVDFDGLSWPSKLVC